MDAWREALLAEGKTWLGTRWHHNARVKGAGVDCGHYIIGSYVGAGLVADFEVGSYPIDWAIHQEEERYLGWVEQYLDPVDVPLPGDVVVYRFGKCYSHGGIVVEWPLILHAYRRERAVVYGDGDRGVLGFEHLAEGGSAPRPRLFYSIAGRL
jgi:cell wall-associated NlpC family hydrolase